jgi:adenylosuccinate lyase
LLKIIDKGYTREEAYRIVQKHALEALSGGDFRLGISDEGILSESELNDCFNIEDYLHNIDKVFEKFN